MGMANFYLQKPKPASHESALLKCESCGRTQRVWLNKCRACTDPLDSWYEKRIAELEKTIREQDGMIRNQADELNKYPNRFGNT